MGRRSCRILASWLGNPPAGWLAAAVVAILITLLGLSTNGTWVLEGRRLRDLGVIPHDTLRHWWRHFSAAFLHRDGSHLLFNATVVAVSFPFATRGRNAWATLLSCYLLGPIVVLSIHLAVLLPLADLGWGYAQQALYRPLVGFSVVAYAMAGLASHRLPHSWPRWSFPVAVAGVEGLVGGVLQWTQPFVAAYHVGGFAAGWGLAFAWKPRPVLPRRSPPTSAT